MDPVSETFVRVTYADTDQMGVAYHGRYPIWFEVARTEYLRARGKAYRELEEAGLRLVVSELQVRYRAPARYDDLLRVRCWVRDIASRRVTFGYAIDRGRPGGTGHWGYRPPLSGPGFQANPAS